MGEKNIFGLDVQWSVAGAFIHRFKDEHLERGMRVSLYFKLNIIETSLWLNILLLAYRLWSGGK